MDSDIEHINTFRKVIKDFVESNNFQNLEINSIWHNINLKLFEKNRSYVIKAEPVETIFRNS